MNTISTYEHLADLLRCYGAPGEPDKLREWLSERLDAAVPAKNIVALSCAGMTGEHAGATFYFCERHGKELVEPCGHI